MSKKAVYTAAYHEEDSFFPRGMQHIYQKTQHG